MPDIVESFLKHLSDEEISLLRTIPITFYGPNSVEVGGAKPTITGSADDPCINLFDVGVLGAGRQLALVFMKSTFFNTVLTVLTTMGMR